MKVLVTGNLGYIGTVLTPYLEARGQEVRGLDVGYFEDCMLEEVSGPADQLHRDIRDVESVDLDDVEGVVHLAGPALGAGGYLAQRQQLRHRARRVPRKHARPTAPSGAR